MGQVVDLLRRAYSGAVADMAAITPADGDSFYATDTDQLFIGHGGSWVHWPRWVRRPAALWDKAVGDFITDGTEKVDGLDLSAIVPVGAITVHLGVFVNDDAANSEFRIRQNGVNVRNWIAIRTQVANVTISKESFIDVDPDRLLDYKGDNLAFISIDVVVLGWFI